MDVLGCFGSVYRLCHFVLKVSLRVRFLFVMLFGRFLCLISGYCLTRSWGVYLDTEL